MRQRALAFLVTSAVLTLGAWSEVVSHQQLWFADFLVGLAYLVAGVLSWPRERGTATLLVLVSVTWYVGGLMPAAVYWHRGVLIQLLMAYPGRRWRTRPEAVVVAVGYGLALTAPSSSELINAAFFLPALVVLVLEARRSVSVRRRHLRTAGWAAASLVAVTCLGSWARTTTSGGVAASPALLAYEAVLA